MARAEAIAVALLAAGRSTRFGEADKLTARLGDRRLIDWSTRTGRGIAAGWHMLVMGADAAYDPTALGYAPLVNPAPDQGLASSLRIAATRAEQLGARALLILLADMPFVSPAHLERLIAAFLADGSTPIFSASPAGIAQPPALFPASCFPALRAREGDKGARALADTARLIEADGRQLTDIDTVADLDAANRKLDGEDA